MTSSHKTLHPDLDRTLDLRPRPRHHPRMIGRSLMAFAGRRSVSIAVALVTISALMAGVLVVTDEGRAYFPLSPIRIDGNSDLQVGMNGVTAGTGSASDPYVISAWDIDAGSSVGIYIGNTTAHLLISNVYVHTSDGWPFYAGIHMFNVANGRVNNSILSGNLSYCIYIEQSSSIRITHNNMSGQFANAVFADTVNDLTVSENDFYRCYGSGVTARYSNNTVVNRNNFIRTSDAVYAIACTNFTIHANQVNGMGSSALWVAATRNAAITCNNVTGEFRGIMLSGTSYDILVQGNTVTDSDYAITAQNVARAVIRDNIVNDSDNAGDWGSYGSRGISLETTSHMQLWNNTMLHCGIVLYGQTLAEYNRHIIAQNNTVNGLPVLYYKNQTGIALNGEDAGGVIVANCTNVALSGLDLLDSDVGLQLAFSSNVTVQDCNLSDSSYAQLYMRSNRNVNFSGCVFSNGLYGVVSFTSFGSTSNISFFRSAVLGNQYDGMYMYRAVQMSIVQSKIAGSGYSGAWLEECDWGNITLSEFSNNSRGLYLDDCTNYKIWHNDFINNTVQALDSYSNLWDDGYPSGGNYWDNFTVSDDMRGPLQNIDGSDGIGDDPFWLDPNSLDNYPLMQPIPELRGLILPTMVVLGLVLCVRARRRRA